MRTRTRLTLAGAALTTVALAGTVVLPAVADDGDTTTEERTDAVPDRAQRHERVQRHRAEREAAQARRQTSREERQAHREEHRAAFAAALADELGIDAERVATALETVRAELHDQVPGSDLAHPGRGDGLGPRGGHRLWHDGATDDDAS
jgi:uncharacterized membrane protein